MHFSTINIYFIYFTLIICSCSYCYGYYIEISKPERNSYINCSNECSVKVTQTSPNAGSVQSCTRGCRFFEIAQLIYQGNCTRNGCVGYCEESYGELKLDLLSCKTGCEIAQPSEPIGVPTLAEISWLFLLVNGQLLGKDETEVKPPVKEKGSEEETKAPDTKVRITSIRDIACCLHFPTLLLLNLAILSVVKSIKEKMEALNKNESEINQEPPLIEKPPLA